MDLEIRRLETNPIVTPATNDGIGENVNGPSLVRVPDWIDDPLGEYYLYFAHHGGEYIRLAYADDLEGPWEIHAPGTLHLDEAGEGFDDHVASPDVHLDHDEERVRMYYHGCCDEYRDATGRTNQYTRVALSENGLDFDARTEPLGRFYFRAFEYGEYHYALAKEDRRGDRDTSGQRVYRSPDPLSGFESGPLLFGDGSRHAAVRRRGDALDVFYSRIGDAPERILRATVDLAPEWTDWEATEPETVLEPEREWEGADRPVEPSRADAADERVHQLRDPGIYEEDGDAYLLYSVAGERGLAIARLRE